jgi:PIN like domain
VDFYLDASIPFPVSQALALVRDDVLYPGAPGCPITTPDVKDHEWLAVAGHHGWAVLMRD